MEQLLEFITRHWLLVFIAVGLLFLLLLDSNAKSGKKLSPNELTRLMNHDHALVIDLRDNTDFQKGHLVNAINIPHSQLDTKLSELKGREEFKKKTAHPIVLVCKDGQRSILAGKRLKQEGFSVFRLGGGVLEWTQQNLPLIK